MIFTLILWLSLIWMPILIAVTNNNEAKFKKNIAVGVTFPIEGRTSPEVAALLAKFKKQQWIVAIALMVIAIPALFVKDFSLTMTLWCTWMVLCIAVPYIPYVLCNRRLKLLKQEKGWKQPFTGTVSVDFSLIPDDRWLSPWIFLGAFVLSFLPLLWERDMWFLYLVDALLILFFWFAYRYLYRNKAEKVDDDPTLTKALTRIRRKNWGTAWILCAYSMVLLNLAASFTFSLPILSVVLFVLSMLIMLIGVIAVEFRTRALQEKLTASSGSGSYVDEDDYWPGGMLYYNPKDSRTIVNYRVGTNTTVNLARPGGKIFMGLTLVLVLLLPFTGVIIDNATGGEIVLEITETADSEDQLFAKCGGTKYEIPLDSVESVTLLEELPAKLTRTWGTGMEHLLSGNFGSKDYGSLQVCIDPTVKPFLLVETSGKTYLLGCRDSAATRALYETLKEAL